MAATRFGRQAVVQDLSPVLVVLNHAWDGRSLSFRTGETSTLARLTLGDDTVPAVFEADSTFPMDHEGWSVRVASGSARPD